MLPGFRRSEFFSPFTDTGCRPALRARTEHSADAAVEVRLGNEPGDDDLSSAASSAHVVVANGAAAGSAGSPPPRPRPPRSAAASPRRCWRSGSRRDSWSGGGSGGGFRRSGSRRRGDLDALAVVEHPVVRRPSSTGAGSSANRQRSARAFGSPRSPIRSHRRRKLPERSADPARHSSTRRHRTAGTRPRAAPPASGVARGGRRGPRRSFQSTCGATHSRAARTEPWSKMRGQSRFGSCATKSGCAMESNSVDATSRRAPPLPRSGRSS